MRTARGEGAGWERKGKRAKGQLTCGHLGIQGENEESPSSAEWLRIANG